MIVNLALSLKVNCGGIKIFVLNYINILYVEVRLKREMFLFFFFFLQNAIFA